MSESDLPNTPGEHELASTAEEFENAATEIVDTAQGFRDRMRDFRISKGDVVQVLATVGGCLLYREHYQQQPPLADAFAIFSAAGIAGMYVDARYENADVLPQLPRRIVLGLATAGVMAFGPGAVDAVADKIKQVKLPDFRPQIESVQTSIGNSINESAKRIQEDPRIVLTGIGIGTLAAGARKIQHEMQEHQPIKTAVATARNFRKDATVKSDIKALRRAGSVAWEYSSYHVSKLTLKGIRCLSGMAARKFSRLESRMDARLSALDSGDTLVDKAGSN